MTSEPSAPVLSFLGATRTVTGSRFLLETPAARVLVDCGLYQGLKEYRLRNWDPLPIDPSSIDAVVLTHAHVDHCGYLPRLCRGGFAGPVHVTDGTAELCGIVLPDAGHLQEEEAAYANRKGFSKHRPALPLFTEQDARASLRQLARSRFSEPQEIAPGLTMTFRHAGHILGAATITMEIDGPTERRIVFSGDLGRPTHPVLKPPEPVGAADLIVIESTYGDQRHPRDDFGDDLAGLITRTAERGGSVIIPAFAVDRTEVVLFRLRQMFESGTTPQLPVYVDSPMALAALGAYRRALARRSPEVRADCLDGGDPFDTGTLVEVRDVEDSIELNRPRYPSVIISASGMATGGRVVHHLKAMLPDRRNAVALVGFQAAGTRGRTLADGAAHVKMLGRYVPVRAEVVKFDGLSVHADGDELVEWLRTADRDPDGVFIVHGEPRPAEALQSRIRHELNWLAMIPRYRERIRLD
ncbi:MAG: Ribonuclease [Acidimicrobiales bacterium]|nr:Ribonuclease [Acidimicrobiales bacterium]